MANIKVRSNIHTNIAGQEVHPGGIVTITLDQFKQYTMSGGHKRKGLPHLQRVSKDGAVIEKRESYKGHKTA